MREKLLFLLISSVPIIGIRAGIRNLEDSMLSTGLFSTSQGTNQGTNGPGGITWNRT